MERYLNRGGDSGVVAYHIEDASIDVEFKDGWIYLYTVQSAGFSNIEAMKKLAINGEGLNSFISRTVKKGYASKRK